MIWQIKRGPRKREIVLETELNDGWVVTTLTFRQALHMAYGLVASVLRVAITGKNAERPDDE